MAPSLSLGIALTLLAGLMAGNCMLPLKFNRTWKWENSWLVFSVVSLVILPWMLALGLVDHLFDAYRGLSLLQIFVPFLFGAGWGVAQVLFGLSVQRLGLGLGYAIIVGLGALLGTLVPLFAQHRSQVSRPQLIEILAGVAVMVIGVSLSAWGGANQGVASSINPAGRALEWILRSRPDRDLVWRVGANAQLLLCIWPGHCAAGGEAWKHAVTFCVCCVAYRTGRRLSA